MQASTDQKRSEISKMITAQSKQAEDFIQRYEGIVEYVELGIIRAQFILDIFTKISDIMKEAEGSLDSGFLPFNSAENKSTLMQNGLQLYHFPSCYLQDFVLYSGIIDHKISESLSKVISTSQTQLDSCQKKVETIQKTYQEAIAQCSHVSKNVEKLYNDTLRAYQKYNDAKSQGTSSKALNKFFEAVQTATISYHVELGNLSISVANLNDIYNKFCQTLEKCMKAAADIDKKRINEINNSCNLFRTPLENMSKSIANLIPTYSSIKWDWETEFINFIESLKVVRSNLSPVPFHPLPFSFEDASLPVPKVLVDEDVDRPIDAMTVDKSFTARLPNEITVNEGTFVYIYELPKHDWTFVSTIEKDRKGFVPSSILKPHPYKVGLVVKTYIPLNNKEIIVSAGESILIKELKNNCYYALNSKGMIGLVPEDCIVLQDLRL
ncbi:hypothetical protein TRFO_28512 [Tritrichomonas foetus]|uniref:SH3 domain-containing protein n=1 Tax=Tritrichomonas foetus TaxID=1144522 RepID=A0A1J4JYK3_9EUKA|nr:hypothetical protein TRFO_28512 [Tritrichomonas foetus]|eukprot:OHT04067.1 hypothetical protein TRFO_28512 [Tritrichomonas foetus]